jgi:hypothetical protein
MKHLLFVLMISAAFTGLTACKNNNPSGTPPKNDTAFINRNGNDSSGGSSPATPATGSSSTDTTGQKKDSTGTKK